MKNFQSIKQIYSNAWSIINITQISMECHSITTNKRFDIYWGNKNNAMHSSGLIHSW